jgi:hypothetical protein
MRDFELMSADLLNRQVLNSEAGPTNDGRFLNLETVKFQPGSVATKITNRNNFGDNSECAARHKEINNKIWLS